MTKIHIVSGFLGSGKTTLIKKLIKKLDGKKVIIENEFGEVGIDGEVIGRENYDVIELAQGCICCSMKTDFEEAILSILKDYSPEHIIIEPTGIGMLSHVLSILKIKKIRDRCLVISPITIVDTLDYFEQLDNFGGFFTDQIGNAGTLVFSKVQMMEVDNLHKIVDSVRELNKEAEIISCDWDDFDDFDYNSLINMQFDLEKNSTSYIESTSEISDGIQSISIKSPKKFRKNELENMMKEITKDKYGIVIRSKGFINGDDGSLEFSFVNGRFTISKNEFNNSDRVCIIGRNLDEDNIFKLLL
ncbi:GTP-binding protein [Clostridioides mangenotii]|uniref:CobW family GTP-binding protein n=1 Tax=Metaclostridioides mangenotii TaxID=1540 RepID=UPI001C11F97A|nr:GTP-binding protein [Clostridioides mangenotii]MBU5306788.1 GTP-binding protein [Clostridioides mangenotii]